jgi:hypothetical protein
MYTVFFNSFVVSSTCFGCYLHPSSEAQLQRTAIDFVWFGVLFHWSRYWFGTHLNLSTVSYSLDWCGKSHPYRDFFFLRILCLIVPVLDFQLSFVSFCLVSYCMLWIFPASVGSEPAILGTRGQHANP